MCVLFSMLIMPYFFQILAAGKSYNPFSPSSPNFQDVIHYCLKKTYFLSEYFSDQHTNLAEIKQQLWYHRKDAQHSVI